MNITSMEVFRSLFLTGGIKLERVEDSQLDPRYQLVDSQHYGYKAGYIFTGVLLYNAHTDTYIQRDIRIDPLTLHQVIETYVLKEGV